MHLAADYVHPYQGGDGARSQWRIRVYPPDDEERDAPVVVASEFANNPSTSITNAAG